MRPPGSANGGRSCRESWKTSGRRSWAGLQVRKPFPSTAALPVGCFSHTHHTNAATASLARSPPRGLSPTTLSCPPKQTTLPKRPRNPSPSQPGQIAWPGNMPRSASGSSMEQGEPADPRRLRAPVTAGGSRRRSSASFESEPGPRRRNCGRAEPGGSRRLPRTQGWSPGLGPGQSPPEEQPGAASGALAMCPGPALGEGTRRPWLQPW